MFDKFPVADDIARGAGFGGENLGERRVGAVAGGLVERDGSVAFAPPPIPIAIVGEVDGDFAEPCCQGRLAAKFFETPVRVDKNILRYFLGVLRIVEKPVRRGINATPITRHYFIKCRMVAASETVGQQLARDSIPSFHGYAAFEFLMHKYTQGTTDCVSILPDNGLAGITLLFA